MPKLTVDITKRKNRYCAHCENCRRCDFFCHANGQIVSRWGCCKKFRWRLDIMEKYRRNLNTKTFGSEPAAGTKSKPFQLTCETFGNWLRMEKEKRGLRIIDVEKMSGVSKYSIGQYLTQDYSPSLYTVQLLTEAFGKKIVIVDKGETL